MPSAFLHSFDQHRFARYFKKTAQRHRLRYLFLEITRRCNFNCIYCGSECSPVSAVKEIGSDGWIDVLHQIAHDYNPKDIMLAITGGEPLLKDGFFDIIREAGTLGFPFGVVTNGSLLTRDTADKLASSGMGSISISLDGPREINDLYRGKGSAEKVEEAVANLHAAGYNKILEIISTIASPTIPHLKNLRKAIAKMHVARWRLAPVIPIGRAALKPELVPGADELRDILEFVKSGRADGLLPKPEFGEECYLGDEFELVTRPFRFMCRAGLSVGGILSDGRITACPELPDFFVQGHIYDRRFSDVWENSFQVFRNRDWTKHGLCASCDSFSVCQGGSLHLYKDMNSEPLRCFYRMLQKNKPVMK